MSTADLLPPETLPEHTLRELCLAGAARDAVIAGMPGGGYAIQITYGPEERSVEKVLGTTRGGIRRFASLDTAASFLRELKVDRFRVDMRHHQPGLVRAPRPDRAEALRKTRTTPRQASLLL